MNSAYPLIFAITSRHSLHLSVTYCQSSALTLSDGNSFDPIPTQKTPALNHDVRLASSGATPPVTIIFDQGIGAMRPLMRFGPTTSPGKTFVKSQPLSSPHGQSG